MTSTHAIKAALWLIGIVCAALALAILAGHELRGKFNDFFEGEQ